MANLQASIKDDRQNKRRAVFNARIKKRAKSAVKKFNTLVSEGKKKEAEGTLSGVYAMLDKAAKRGVIKKGNASRRKARLAKKFNNLAAPNVKTAKKTS